MRHSISILIVAVVAVGAGACYGDAAHRPGLVYVNPDVGVVVDAEAPTFYAHDYFWRYDQGTWYRSRDANRGWVRAMPPYVVTSLPDPGAYTHYHPYTAYHARAD
jgi:hypothetical protein